MFDALRRWAGKPENREPSWAAKVTSNLVANAAADPPVVVDETTPYATVGAVKDGSVTVYSFTAVTSNLRSASLWSGLRLDESFRRHFESGYALDKGCFQPAYAINQA